LFGIGIVCFALFVQTLTCVDATKHVVPRTREGYYHYTGGIKAAIKRSLAYAPYVDLIWLETKSPNLEQARGFSREIRKKFPGKWLVYNLSPSFNWAGHGFSGAFLCCLCVMR